MNLEKENSSHLDFLKGEYYVINTAKRIFGSVVNHTPSIEELYTISHDTKSSETLFLTNFIDAYTDCKKQEKIDLSNLENDKYFKAINKFFKKLKEYKAILVTQGIYYMEGSITFKKHLPNWGFLLFNSDLVSITSNSDMSFDYKTPIYAEIYGNDVKFYNHELSNNYQNQSFIRIGKGPFGNHDTFNIPDLWAGVRLHDIFSTIAHGQIKFYGLDYPYYR